jgi:hypothetical protein
MNIHVQFGFNCPGMIIGRSSTKFLFFYADRKFKMANTAGHRLTLDPMGKCSNAFTNNTWQVHVLASRIQGVVQWIIQHMYIYMFLFLINVFLLYMYFIINCTIPCILDANTCTWHVLLMCEFGLFFFIFFFVKYFIFCLISETKCFKNFIGGRITWFVL